MTTNKNTITTNTENKTQISIAIVVADFNEEITQEMVKVAEKRAKEKNIHIAQIVHVPGVFDMPLAVKKLLQRENIQGIVTLGVVISGGTSHDAHVADNAARQISNLTLEYEKPVALSIIGHTVSKQQAIERYESYAKHGVDAVVELIETLNKI